MTSSSRYLTCLKYTFLVSLSVTPSAQADNKEKSSFIQSMNGFAKSVLALLPSDLSIAVGTYIEVMQPDAYRDDDVGRANLGLEKSNNKDMSGSCERKLLTAFYESQTVQRAAFNDAPISILDNKPNGVKPGWVWERAMALTDGNPNLAIKIIGYCGHDDISQISRDADTSFSCPYSKSIFYSHQALGEKVDIDPSLKKYIADTQSIHADPKLIKAKNYHLMGSALLGCRMIENGVPKEKIPDYAQMFSYLYRRIAVCRSSRKNIDAFEKVTAVYDRNLKKFNTDKTSKVPRPSMTDALVEAIRDRKTLNDDKSGLLQGYAYKYERLKSEDDRKKYIDRVVTNYFASKYYVTETNCPTGRSGEFSEGAQMVSLPRNIMKTNLVFGQNAAQFDEKCPQIAGDYCGKVGKHLLTWDADFKWTMAQHRVGSEFGANKCSIEKDQVSKIPRACTDGSLDLDQTGRISKPFEPEFADKKLPTTPKSVESVK